MQVVGPCATPRVRVRVRVGVRVRSNEFVVHRAKDIVEIVVVVVEVAVLQKEFE